MAQLLPFEHISPQLDPTVFVAPGAQIIGDVHIGAESSIWYNCVLRGDVFPIRIGQRTNFQDLSLGHVTGGQHALIIGDEVTIGHRVVVHGCTIGSRCLIGMGSVILDGVDIGEECLIGAGALVTPNTKIPAGSMVLGAPAKFKRTLTAEERAMIRQSADSYVRLAVRHRNSIA